MKRYFKILAIILKNSYIRDSKIIGSVSSSIMMSLVEILITLTLFSAIFNNTNSIAGWNFYQMIFLYTLLKSMTLINGIVARGGLAKMSSEYVRRGDYDFYLTKPLNSMLLVSMSKPRVYNVMVLIPTIALAIYAALRSGISIGLGNIMWFLVAFIIGTVLFYFINVITIVPVFWFVRLFSLKDLMNRFSQFMRYPSGIYSFATRVIFYSILPILVVTYLPAWFLFNPPSPVYIIYMLGITVLFGFIAERLWKLGEKHYGSASS